MKLRLTMIAVVVLALTALTLAYAQQIDFAGEKMLYEIGWSNISAATAEVQVQTATEGGVPCYKIVMLITGKPKLDWIWKVRDRIELTTTQDKLRCRRYLFQQREARFLLDTDMRLDASQNLLLSARTRYKQDEAQALKPKQATADHYDPLSALFYVRRAPMSPGKVYKLPVFDGKRTHELIYSIIGEERIKIGMGEFDAWKIWPRIVRSSGDDAESKVNKVQKAFLWIDKKAPHHVLKVESEAFVGSIYAELVKLN